MTTNDQSLATIEHLNLPPAVQSGTGVATIARAEIDAQTSVAKQYPRDISLCIARARGLATMNKDTAARMFYAIKDGVPVKGMPNGAEFGPSVRLTEIFTSTYGNIQNGARMVEITDQHVIVAGFAHDLEANTKIVCEETASIITKDGRRYSERLIIRTAQAAMAKARRNAILQVIPRVFIEQVMQAALRVAAGADKPKTERWRDLVARFTQQRVTDKQMLALIEKTGIADMTDDDFAALESYLAQIVDREATIDSLLADAKSERGTNPAADLT